VLSVHRLLEISRLVLSRQNNRLVSFYMSSAAHAPLLPGPPSKPDGIMYRMEVADIPRATALIRANRERLLGAPEPAPKPAGTPVAVPAVMLPTQSAQPAESAAVPSVVVAAGLSAEAAFARSAVAEAHAELSPTSELLFQLSDDFSRRGSSVKAVLRPPSIVQPKSGQPLVAVPCV
jgi:hypothetical protein